METKIEEILDEASIRNEQKEKDIDGFCKWLIEKFGSSLPGEFFDELRDELMGTPKDKISDGDASSDEIMMHDWFKLMNNRGEWIESIKIDSTYMSLLAKGKGFFVVEPVPLTEEILDLNPGLIGRNENETRGICSYGFIYEDGCLTDGVDIVLKYVHELQHFMRLCGHKDEANALKIK